MPEVLNRSNHKRTFVDAVIIGATNAVVLLALLVLISVPLGRQQREDQTATRVNTARTAAAIICGLSAPTKQIVQPNGTVQTLRPEGFMNANCLIANGFDPVDINGDGEVVTEPEEGSEP